jgi:SAM-dependent methyltransferase
MATAAQLRALLAAPDLLDAASSEDAAHDIAAAERLRRRWPADLVAAATEQAELRQRAAGRIDRAGELLLTRAGLEQATSTAVAAHRARRFTGVDRVLDLCCGVGGDLTALAAAAGTVIGVDHDETHAVCARHNVAVAGVAAAVAVSDVREVQLPSTYVVFVDPARRSATAGAGDQRGGCSPALDWCFGLPVERVAVKAAPGIDVASVPPGWEREFVAIGRDLKEASLWSPAWATAASRATVLPAGDSLVADPGAPPADVGPPGRFLLDPSPAVTRAGAVADLAALVGGWQVDPRIAFLSADVPLQSPFGRSFAVEASLPFSVKSLAAELHRLDIGAIDLRRRGLAGDVDLLRRRLRPSGARRATVMLTRVLDKPWTLVCTDLPGT